MTRPPTNGSPRRRLLIIVSERISEWIEKGEVVDRYYNPGDVFDEVHLLLTNDDRPHRDSVERMVGRARVTIHNAPPPRPLIVRSLGYRPALLRRWARPVVATAERVQPDLVRCYGAWINAFAAREIRRSLGIPYAVSLHINPEVDVRERATAPRERVIALASRTMEREALRDAELVLPVYRPIVPYLRRIGVGRYEVAYNAVNDAHIRIKSDYRLGRPVRLVSVGRQMDAKLPDQLMRAVAGMPDVHLTLVGSGPAHEALRTLAAELGPDRFAFETALPNDELCARLPTFDAFATHTEYYEISKAVIEALLTGLPVVLNARIGDPVPELEEAGCVLVPNTPDGYRGALTRLIADDAFREQLGRNGREVAEDRWSPAKAEARVASLYRELLGERPAPPVDAKVAG